MTKHFSFVIFNYFIACSGWYDQRSSKFPLFITSHIQWCNFSEKTRYCKLKANLQGKVQLKDTKKLTVCSNSDCLLCMLQSMMWYSQCTTFKMSQTWHDVWLIVYSAMAMYVVFVQKLSSKFHISYTIKYDSKLTAIVHF